MAMAAMGGKVQKWHACAELTAVIAFANFTTRSNVGLGIESDGFAAACRLKPIAPRAAVS